MMRECRVTEKISGAGKVAAVRCRGAHDAPRALRAHNKKRDVGHRGRRLAAAKFAIGEVGR
jgi:hypothetical protein